MKRRYLAVIVSVAVLLSAGSYILVGSSRNPARAAPRPRPLSDAPWGANVKVNDDTDAARLTPAIAVEASGNAYAVWADSRSGNSDIYFSYRPTSGSWGTNVKVIDDLGTAWQGDPAIALDPSGNAYAVWEDRVNLILTGSDIYFSYRPAGGSWGLNVRVNDDWGSAAQYAPAIGVDPSGNAYAVWQDYRNGETNSDIYFSYRPAGGSWGANVKVNDDPGTENQASPAIAVDPSGNAYAVWRDRRNGVGRDIYSSYRPFGGSWGSNVSVNDDPGTAWPDRPTIAVDPSGNAYAAWQDYRNGDTGIPFNPDIYSSYWPFGGSWGANVRVHDDPGTAEQWSPAIAVDGSGNAYAVWEDWRSGNYDIYFSYRLAGYEIYLPIVKKNYQP